MKDNNYINAIKYMKNFTFQNFFLIFFTIVSFVFSGTEWVTVIKILNNDDHAIIVRRNGEAYQIEKGIGCISLWRYGGKQVLINSPGLFLGIGSRIIIPDISQECRIWNSTYLGLWNTVPTPQPQYILTKKEILYIQVSLQLLGFLNKDKKELPDSTVEKGCLEFQKSINHKSGALDQETVLMLSSQIQTKYKENKKAQELADKLFEISLKLPKVKASIPNYDEDHWIQSISNGGEFVTLENGSIWQVDPIDVIYSMLWLPTEKIMVCNESLMININNSNQIHVTRIK